MDDETKHDPIPDGESEPELVDAASEAGGSDDAIDAALDSEAATAEDVADEAAADDDAAGEPVAEAGAEPETEDDAGAEASGEDEYDDEYAPADDEEPDSEPAPAFDWAAIGVGAAVAAADSDVPDLTATGETSFEVDIDAALAAVDSLDTVVAAEQQRRMDEAARVEAQQRAEDEYRRWAASYVFSRPGMIRVQGGRIVTILPAVALMAVGAVLTLATASGQTLTWQTFGAAACAGLALSLVSYWMASGRWARGAFFAALIVACIGGWLFTTTIDGLTLPWWLPFTLLGAAIALTGLLSRPFSAVWLMTGAAIAVGSALVTLFAFGPLITAAPFVLGAAAVLAILPLLFRPRRA